MEYINDSLWLELKCNGRKLEGYWITLERELCLTLSCKIKLTLLNIIFQSLAYLSAFQIYSASSTQSVGQTRESVCVFHCSGR